MQMKNKPHFLLVGLLAICLVMASGVAQAASAAKSKAGSKTNMMKLMRDAGFKHETAQWTSVMTQTPEKGKPTKTESKIWIAGDKYRMESKDKDGKLGVYIDDGSAKYMYTPSEKKAIKLNAFMESMQASFLNSDLVAESMKQRKNAKPAGKEVVEGKACTIYLYKSTMELGMGMGKKTKVTSDVKEWVWDQEKIPVKSIIKTPGYKMSLMIMETDVPPSTNEVIMKDLVVDKPIAEELFKIPAGVKIEEMEELPEGAQGIPDGKNYDESNSGKQQQTDGKGSAKEEEPPVQVQDLLKSFF